MNQILDREPLLTVVYLFQAMAFPAVLILRLGVSIPETVRRIRRKFTVKEKHGHEALSLPAKHKATISSSRFAEDRWRHYLY